MKHSMNPNKAKIHRSYTVEEIAEFFSVHKNTVRAWLKSGLPVCDDRKPMLILGADLRAFLQDKNSKRKQKCKAWEMYCVRCRKPQTPMGGMVDYVAENDTRGRLTGLCPECEGGLNKYINLSAVEALGGKLDVALPRALNHLNKIDNPLLNSDFNK
mgnify:CR=1 FL=1